MGDNLLAGGEVDSVYLDDLAIQVFKYLPVNLLHVMKQQIMQIKHGVGRTALNATSNHEHTLCT